MAYLFLLVMSVSFTVNLGIL